MTAFARSQSETERFQLVWELKSVNHRFLETHFRMPDQLRGIEPGLRELARAHLKRGKVDCAFKLDRKAGEVTIELNRPLLLQMLAILEQVRRDAPEISSPNPMDLLRWPGMLGDSGSIDEPEIVPASRSLFEQALTDLLAHRQREGSGLKTAINERLDDIDTIIGELKSLTLNIPHELQSRIDGRLTELKASIDPARLEQEVALLAQRADVSEELDRLAIHVEEARSNLSGPGPHGRRLDFLSQELNREANTLGAKSVLARASQRVVDLKVIIEQIREQVQNIE
ncbi:MAG: YicC/YloC family endoribonuclease [Pseudomonadales bacterium]|nr:YicC/YloC family endoribonuclease [Pseudomonadales bacterium]MDP6469431.1 YicC/YloC family endoribonuclease [Pseudomonadales bacterium]MDP6827273.1 YicC/YloC family endoribonuclease [Pseudomonadales bacterium]MDP6971096.1 YicC/YloC family endoribonuclease [Pseudomonadales bacterium]